MKKSSKLFVFTALTVVIVDQITKFFVSRYLVQKILIISNFFELEMVKNTGAGFGLFQDSAALLAWVSVIVTGAIIYYYDKIPKDNFTQLFLALILAGTIGNLIDRVLFGYVIDFLAFSFWPAFNVADSAIAVGALGLIIHELRKADK